MDFLFRWRIFPSVRIPISTPSWRRSGGIQELGDDGLWPTLKRPRISGRPWLSKVLTTDFKPTLGTDRIAAGCVLHWRLVNFHPPPTLTPPHSLFRSINNLCCKRQGSREVH